MKPVIDRFVVSGQVYRLSRVSKVEEVAAPPEGSMAPPPENSFPVFIPEALFGVEHPDHPIAEFKDW